MEIEFTVFQGVFFCFLAIITSQADALHMAMYFSAGFILFTTYLCHLLHWKLAVQLPARQCAYFCGGVLASLDPIYVWCRNGQWEDVMGKQCSYFLVLCS